MKISNIILEMSPYYQPHGIELHCKMIIDGKEFNWHEVVPDSDFESRAERYLDYMRDTVIGTIKNRASKEEK